MNYLEMHELYHHGIKGQRWGVRRAKWYPISEFKKFAQSRRDKKIAKLEAKTNRLKSKSDKYSKIETVKKQPTPEEREAARKKEAQEILDSHDIKKIWANKDKLSNEDIQNAIARYNVETSLNQLIPKDKSRMQKTQEFLTQTATLARTVSDLSSSASTLVKNAKEIKRSIDGKKTPEEIEKARAKEAKAIMDTHDLNKIYENRNKLSTKELQEVNNRAAAEANLYKKTDAAKKEEQSKEASKPAAQETPMPSFKAPTALRDTLVSNPEKVQEYMNWVKKHNYSISKGNMKHSGFDELDFFLSHADRKDHKYIDKYKSKIENWVYVYANKSTNDVASGVNSIRK